jgi:hypothetical protein
LYTEQRSTEISVPISEYIKFGFLALIVIVLAVVSRRGQTVHPAPGQESSSAPRADRHAGANAGDNGRSAEARTAAEKRRSNRSIKR